MTIGRTGVFLGGRCLSNPRPAIPVVLILDTFCAPTRLNHALKLRFSQKVHRFCRPMFICIRLQFDEGLGRVWSIRFKGVPNSKADKEEDE